MLAGSVPPEVAGLARPIPPPPEVYSIPKWGKFSHPQRIAVLRRIARAAADNPRVIETAIDAIRHTKERDYRAQVAALLRYVQRNIYYSNEAGERLQDPWYTIRHRLGDCDDMAMLLAAMAMAIRLPVLFVLSGPSNGVIEVQFKGGKRRFGRRPRARKPRAVRWIEGTPVPKGVKWSHIYLQIGWPPDDPQEWAFGEPTLGVPLGWDVVGHEAKGGANILPEMRGAGGNMRGLSLMETDSASPKFATVGAALQPHIAEFKESIADELRPGRFIARLLMAIVFGVVGIILIQPAVRRIMKRR